MIISIDGLSGEKVVMTLKPVAIATIRKPPGGFIVIQNRVDAQKMTKVIRVPFKCSMSHQRKCLFLGISSSSKNVGTGLFRLFNFFASVRSSSCSFFMS